MKIIQLGMLHGLGHFYWCRLHRYLYHDGVEIAWAQTIGNLHGVERSRHHANVRGKVSSDSDRPLFWHLISYICALQLMITLSFSITVSINDAHDKFVVQMFYLDNGNEIDMLKDQMPISTSLLDRMFIWKYCNHLLNFVFPHSTYKPLPFYPIPNLHMISLVPIIFDFFQHQSLMPLFDCIVQQKALVSIDRTTCSGERGNKCCHLDNDILNTFGVTKVAV